MKTLNERLLAAREALLQSPMAATREAIDARNSMIDAIEEAASDALVTDTALYLPVPLVLKQQKEYEARIAVLESQLAAMTQARDDAVTAAHLAHQH